MEIRTNNLRACKVLMKLTPARLQLGTLLLIFLNSPKRPEKVEVSFNSSGKANIKKANIVIDKASVIDNW